MGIKADPVIEHLRISKMEVDVDKNWDDKGITRMKEVADSMREGDIVTHNGATIAKLVPGDPSFILKTNARTGMPEFVSPV